jgi:hypothetical protein
MKLRLFPAGFVAGAIVLFALWGQANALTLSITSQDTSDFTIGTLPGSSTNPAWVIAQSNLVALQTGQIPNVYRSPFENAAGTAAQHLSDNGFGLGGAAGPWSTLQYTSIQAGGKATYNFATPMTTFGFLWGSPDTYNHITFYTGLDATGSSFSISGTNPPINIQTFGHDQILFHTDGGLTFLSVVLTTTQNAFEYANLFAFGPPSHENFPTPLPAALPLFATGLGTLGLFGWRRKQRRSVAS